MPIKVKISLSLLVVLVAAIVAWLEFAGARADLGVIVLAIAAIMLLGLWVFPEAGGGKPDKKEGG